MDFLGIGPLELLLILILALILVGPGKITEIAKTLGKTLRAIKKASSELTATVTRELDATQKQAPASPCKTGETLPVVNKTVAPGQDNQPAKPGEASTTK